MKNLFIFLLIIASFLSCEPTKVDDIDLGPLPEAPEFSIEVDPENENRIIVTDLSEGFFNRLWIANGASPSTSTKVVDTLLYTKAGTYQITLHGAKEGGSGTSSATKEIIIANDATIACDPKLALLTGDCGPEGKCWVFSNAAGAITVGPSYGSGEWFRSPMNGIVPEQMNSSWCFNFQGSEFVFMNNGVTVSPWDGYDAIPHTPTPGPWLFSVGTGMNGVDQIILTPGQFMGTWDSNNVLDVMLLTEDQLVVRTRIVNQDRTPATEGWFEFYFVAE